jgi:hypothetical protein
VNVLSQTRQYWSRNADFIHPYIGFLVNSIMLIRDLTRLKLTKAASFLYEFTFYLDPDIKRKLEHERKELREFIKGTQVLSDDRFFEILDAVMSELHKAGYFAGAKLKTIFVGKETMIPER